MKANRKPAHPGHGAYTMRGRATRIRHRIHQGRNLSHSRTSPAPHESILDMESTLSLLGLIDVLGLEVHTTTHPLYPDGDGSDEET